MNYQTIPGDDSVVLWIGDDGSSGFFRASDPEFESAKAAARTIEVPAPSIDSVVAEYTSALDEYFDLVAKSLGWDDRKTFTLRAGFTGPSQRSAQAFGVWMEDGYAAGKQLMQSVLAGQAPMPASPAAFIATLPPFIDE